MPSVQQVSRPSAFTARTISSTGSQVAVLRPAPGRAHAEARCAGVLRRLCRGVTTAPTSSIGSASTAGVVARRLRAVRAVLGAAAGLDRQQRRELDGIGGVMRAVRLLRPEQELGERQLEQRLDRGDRPACACRRSGMRVGRDGDVAHRATHAKLHRMAERQRMYEFLK